MTQEQDNEKVANEQMRTEVHTIQVVTLDMIRNWLPIGVSLIGVCIVLMTLILKNSERLTSLEASTQYIVHQLDQLSVKVDTLQREYKK